MGQPAGDVVGQLPGGHLAAEGVLGDEGVAALAARENDGGGADLEEEEAVEEGTGYTQGGDGQRGSEGEKESQDSVCQSDLDRAVEISARVEGEPLPGLPPVHRQHLRGGARLVAPHQ